MLKHLLIACLTAFLLLAQQGAVRHALSHSSDATTAPEAEQKHPAGKLAYCSECLAYAVLATALTARLTSPTPDTFTLQHRPAPVLTAFVPAPAHFSPRAPPHERHARA